MKIKLASILILFLASCLPANAANYEDVVINEVAWMGTTVSSNDEWLELKNTTDQVIDLTDWQLNWDGGNILLTGSIQPQGYYLLERTDDDSVLNFTADLIYTGSLGNTGENLLLLDSESNNIDSANFSNGWPVGDNTDKLTMARMCPITSGDDASGWLNSINPNGTPAGENQICSTPPTPECNTTEISRTCLSDGSAEVLYSYEDLICGENFTEDLNDPNCDCTYSDWLDADCSTDGWRQQNRTETSGYEYCDADLTRQVEDTTCVLPPTNITTYSGVACSFFNRHWSCDPNGSIDLDVDNEILNVNIPDQDRTDSFEIVKTKNLNILTLYKTKKDGKKFFLIVNNRSEKVFGFGNKLKFRGSL